MNREEVLYLAPYIFSLLLSLGIFFYTWQHRRVRGARTYSWFLAGQILTILGFIFELISPNLQIKIVWDKFQWLTDFYLVILPFLIFSFRFAEYEYPKLFWGLVTALIGTFTILLATDNLHHLIYPNPYLSTEYPFPELEYDFTWVVYLYSILYVYGANLYGIGLLLRRAFRTNNIQRMQFLIVAVGFSIPVVLSIFSLLNIKIAPQRDNAPFGIAIGNLVVAWGLFRYGLFDIAPIARERIVENMRDPVIVLDPQNRVVDLNRAALVLIGKRSSEVLRRPYQEAFARWPFIVELLHNPEEQQQEVAAKSKGEIFYFDINISHIRSKQQELLGRLIVARDITRHKYLEINYRALSEELDQRVHERTEELRESAERYRAVVESQTEFIVRWKPDGTRTFVNEAYCRYFGISFEQALSSDFPPLILEEDQMAVEQKISRLQSGLADVETDIHRVVKSDGSIGWQEWTDYAIRDEHKQLVEFQSVGRDVTQRMQSEEIILKQLAFDELMTSLLGRFATCSYEEIDNSILIALQAVSDYLGGDFADILLPSSADKKLWKSAYLWSSPQLASDIHPTQSIDARTLPWSEQRLLRGKAIKINSLDDYPPEAVAERKFAKAEGIHSLLSVPIRGKEGLMFGVLDIISYSKPAKWTDNDVTHIQSIGDSIANLLERKQVEEALRKSEERFSKAFQASPVVITISQINTAELLEVNEAFEKVSGYTREEAIGRSTFDLNLWAKAEDRDYILSMILTRGEIRNKEMQFQNKSGNLITCLLSADLIEIAGEKCILATIEDISERKKAEARILHLNRLYVTISEINQTIVHAHDRNSLFQEICHVAIDHGQFRMAWIGLVNDIGDIQPVFFAGEELGYLEKLELNYHDPSLGMGPTGTAIREGHCILCHDIAGDPRMALWREQALSRGYRSSAAVPLREQGRVIGALTVYVSESYWFSAEDEELLEQIGQDVSFALDSIRAELQRQRAEEELAEAYDVTLEGWAKALELRDKETEGHSRRVTKATLVVARAMGFDEEALVHIRRGSILHDIGKMGIPDDILRKNGPLTEDERIIVEKHPGIAYELLKSIPFLEKALDIPYSHHEKWDGSGYPCALKGEDIPLAARIFAVVDVWDALSSDRSYRKAWPQEKVIEYMKNDAGKHFDPQVLEVFLQLLEAGRI